MPLGSIQRVGLLLLAGACLVQGSQDFRSALCMPPGLNKLILDYPVCRSGMTGGHARGLSQSSSSDLGTQS